MPQLDIFTLLFQFKVLFIFFFFFYFFFIGILFPLIHKILFVRRLFLIFLSNMISYFRYKYLPFFFYRQCLFFFSCLKTYTFIDYSFFKNNFFFIFQPFISLFLLLD